jgi:hypothetical protein
MWEPALPAIAFHNGCTVRKAIAGKAGSHSNAHSISGSGKED